MKNPVALVGAVVAACLAVASCTSILGDFNASSSSMDASMPDGTSSGGGEGGQEAGPPNGSPCTTGADCGSGFCADGVCCNNACSGTCESCAVTGHVGTCTGYAMKTDPEKECLSVSQRLALLDAGSDAGEGGVGDGGAEAGDAASDAAMDGGEAGDAAMPADAMADAALDGGNDAQVFNFPEGGVTVNDTPCAGSCNGAGGNGQGACVYPSSTTSCGTPWCNTTTQSAGFACDSQGGCGITTTDCKGYTCEGTACASSCTSTTDCSEADYCDTSSSSGVCKPKLPDNALCPLGGQECLSGACTNVGDTSKPDICCSSDCTSVPGGTCYKAGHEGQCECNIDCGDGGSCVLWYKDFDGDGHGDAHGAVSSGTAQVQCSTNAVPAGWSLTKDDCDDRNSDVHPGQTAYFPYGDPNNYNLAYDYDCDNKLEYQVPQLPGASCSFCNGSGFGVSLTCAADQATCESANEVAGFGCAKVYPPCTSRFCLFLPQCSQAPTTAFTSSAQVQCGATANAINCGSCSAAGGTPAPTLVSTTQACH